MKANSNLSILRLLATLGRASTSFPAASCSGCWRPSRKAAAKVVFSGVGKLAEEIDLALHAGILLFNVESASELDLLAARAAHHRKTANFAIRVNPDVAAPKPILTSPPACTSTNSECLGATPPSFTAAAPRNVI